MQHRSWDDLRFLLAVQRAGSLAGAARRLGVNPTTVSRRIGHLQSALEVTLVQREGDGSLRLTANGEAVAAQADEMEHLAGLIDRGLVMDSDPNAGTVRLTSVPIIVNRILLPNIGELLAPYPALKVELYPDSRDFSLTRREADLALRLSRPRTGGTQIKARRIADLDYAVYQSAASDSSESDATRWITYDDAMAHLPQARWIARRIRGRTSMLSPVRVRDGESALEATLAGLGKSLLPVAIGDRDNRLVRTHDEDTSPDLSRELWLLGHGNLLERGYVRTVMQWIIDIFNGVAARNFDPP